ncbi:MAG TPA: hypothetical protein PLP83_01245 [Candidatus Aminicenantes bacterium]|nr:hypothetical protein [Candidatus Aminicenantes bacterium]
MREKNVHRRADVAVVAGAVAASLALALALVVTASFAQASAQVSPEVRARAAPVFAALERIEAASRRPLPTRIPEKPPSPAEAPGARSLTFSEAEFNAYVACRLADEKEAYVKSAEFKLLDANRVEGRIAIDLGRPQASGVLPQKQDLLLSAAFETRDGRIRIAPDKVFLGTQPISPAFIDLVIGIVSRLQGVEPTTLNDWYDLPPGVLRLETRPGRVVVIY